MQFTDGQLDSPPSTSITQSPGLKWRFQAVESDIDSDNDLSSKRSVGAITPPPMPHLLPFTMAKGTPTQSEGTTITSWDEWDGPDGPVCGIDPIMVMVDGVKCNYQSLL